MTTKIEQLEVKDLERVFKVFLQVRHNVSPHMANREWLDFIKTLEEYCSIVDTL